MCVALVGCGSDTTKIVQVPAPDTTPPVVLFTTATPQITAVFSEPMDTSTIDASTFTVSGATGTVTIADGRTAVFTPTSLAAATMYTATISTGAKDLAGNALAAPVSWSFTTDAAPDTTAPTVTTLSPAAGGTGKASTNTVSVTYDEPIDCTRATDTTIRVYEGANEVPGYVTCSGATVAFHATFVLPTETTLSAYAEPMADLAGNEAATQTVWSFAMGPWTIEDGTANDDIVYAVTVDALNNVYVAGATSGNLGGNTNAGMDDMFVTKYDMAGTVVWTRVMGTSAIDYATGVAVDGVGNVFVTGGTRGNFDGHTSAGPGVNDIFVVKFDSTGAKQWSQQMGTAGNDSPAGIAVDPNGDIIIGGLTAGGLGGNTNAGSTDLFAMKLDTSGSVMWTRELGTTVEEFVTGMALDSIGDVYVVGYTFGSLDGNTNVGGADAFLVKYDNNGTKLWTKQTGSSADDQGNAVAAGPSGGVYIVGSTAGNLQGTNAGQGDAFIEYHDASGANGSILQFGGAGDDSALTVAVDAAGHVFVGGVSNGSIAASTANAGGYDIFVAELDAGVSGPMWMDEHGGAGDDVANAMALDSLGNIYAAGTTDGALDGNSNNGAQDLCVLKYSSDGKAR